MSFYKKFVVSIVLVAVFIVGFASFSHTAYALEQKIFDEAGLLSESEKRELEALATELGDKWDTDIIIVTTNDTNGRYVQYFMEDFYDEKIAEQGLDEWNASVLAVDMGGSDYYIGNFYKAKFYISGSRVDSVLDGMLPYMRNGNYYEAFRQYILLTEKYLSSSPANPIFQWWLQLIIAVVVGAVIVFGMAFNSGGRITVSDRTYMNTSTSRVLNRKDKYIRTTITKTRKPKNTGGGGGGGRTGGGHSYSGGGRSF